MRVRAGSSCSCVLGAIIVAGVLTMAPVRLQAWAVEGHRLVGLVAASRLSPAARQNVAWLLDGRTLAEVSVWADAYRNANSQTGFWHYVNIPANAASYDRDRDCPVQPGVRAGGPGDEWRDCVVDRIFEMRQRLANRSLDRADRATALKFLVHFVGDLHQPFHALADARGGNGIAVRAFGSPQCRLDDGTERPCNLHGVWDGTLLAHRGLDERRTLEAIEQAIVSRNLVARAATGAPAAWAVQSHDLARAARLAAGADADEAYYRAHIAIIDDQLALAGLRLAAMLNDSLAAPPPSR